MNKVIQSYKHRFILLIMLLFIAVFTVFCAVVYSYTESIMREQTEDKAQFAAKTLALVIMSDIDGYTEFLKTNDSLYYDRIRSYFERIAKGGGAAKIYIRRPSASENALEFDFTNEEIFRGSITGNSSVLGQNGEFLGNLYVDYSAESLFDKLNDILTVMVLTLCFISAIILLILSEFAQSIIEPIVNDKQTGAVSRRYFEKFLAAEMKAMAKNGSCLSILMLDLDHFKKVNDTYGHVFGDKVLKVISAIIKDMLKKNDMLVRYGGEEFVIIMPGANLEKSFDFAERIRRTVELSPIFNGDINDNVNVTISIGVSQAAGHGCSIEELVASADNALYVAKTDRNKVCAAKF